MPLQATTPSLPLIYRHALRLARKLPMEPSRANRSLRSHLDGTLYTVKRRTHPAVDSVAEADRLWRQVRALETIVSNSAMNEFPLSQRITQPEGAPNHYLDLAANAGDLNAPSRRTPLQSFLFKYFRLKI